MSDVTIIIHLPERSKDALSEGLRNLTKIICDLDETRDRGFGLGGTYGYGTDFENDVFMMHPYCWCEREDCPWCAGCSCETGYGTPEHAERRRWFKGDVEVGYADFNWDRCEHGEGCIYHNDGRNAPNFLHKPTNFRVSWYKYIGRSMEVEGPAGIDPMDVLASCRASLPTAPSESKGSTETP